MSRYFITAKVLRVDNRLQTWWRYTLYRQYSELQCWDT